MKILSKFLMTLGLLSILSAPQAQADMGETWFSEPSEEQRMSQRRPRMYLKQIDEYHQTRIDRLIKPDGYLSLVGLHWIDEKETQIPGIGKVRLKGQAAHVESEPGFKIGDRDVDALTLSSKDPEGKVVVRKGTLSYYLIKRGPSFALRVKDSESVTRRTFAGIDRFPVDPKWRLEGRIEFAPTEAQIDSVVGIATAEKSPGLAHFNFGGKSYHPILIGEPEDEKYFLVFRDETAGQSTYGACRFLSVEREGEDKLVLDFNKSINPACAFTEFATCPLPPEANVFPFPVTAGEKAPKKHP